MWRDISTLVANLQLDQSRRVGAARPARETVADPGWEMAMCFGLRGNGAGSWRW